MKPFRNDHREQRPIIMNINYYYYIAITVLTIFYGSISSNSSKSLFHIQAIRRDPSLLFKEISSIDDEQNDHRRLLLQEQSNNNHNNNHNNNRNNIETAIQQNVINTVMENSTTSKRSIKKSSTLPQPSDHLITSLPYLNPNTFPTRQYAGYIPASQDDDKKLFYWLFEPDTTTTTTNTDSTSKTYQDDEIPLLIWLNGGPGCSSMDGLFLENGPLRLVKSNPTTTTTDDSDGWSIQINPYSWHKAPAYVLYVDQPVGTGLSFTKKRNYCRNDLQINIDFHLFLENFLLMYHDFFLTKKDIDDNEEGGRGNMDLRTMKRPLYFSG